MRSCQVWTISQTNLQYEKGLRDLQGLETEGWLEFCSSSGRSCRRILGSSHSLNFVFYHKRGGFSSGDCKLGSAVPKKSQPRLRGSLQKPHRNANRRESENVNLLSRCFSYSLRKASLRDAAKLLQWLCARDMRRQHLVLLRKHSRENFCDPGIFHNSFAMFSSVLKNLPQ